MKTISRIFIPVCCAVTLVSCNKEAFQENKDTEEGQQLITAYVNAGGPSKLAYEEVVEGGGAGVSSVWQDGDHFLAIQDGDKTVEFRLVSGAGTTQGVFQTLTSGVTGTTQWVGVVGNGAEAHSSEIHCPYMKQDGTIKSLSGFNYVKVTATGEEPYFNFAEGESLSYVMRIKLPAGIKCIEYTPCAWTKVTSSGTSIVYYNNNNQNDYSAKNTSTITLGTASAKGDIAYIAVPNINFDQTLDTWNGQKQNGNLKSGVIITVMNNVSDNATLSTGTVVSNDYRGKGGLIGIVDISEETLIQRPKPSEAILLTQTTDKAFDKTYKSNSYIYQHAHSLTTYFAPHNIGATKSTEVGNKYAFGEYKVKTAYTFVSYTLRHKPSGTNYYDYLTQETVIETSKFHSVASSRFDVARILWGSAWRMAHYIEFYGHSSLTKVTTVDGVKGIQFTQDSNSVFVPMTSLINGDNTSQQAATNLCSWTANKYSRSQGVDGYDQAFVFGCLDSKTADGSTDVGDYFSRQHICGVPVRPVLASSEVEWY